jgi:DNA processing protein
MLAQSNAYLLQAFPGVVLAVLGPQAAALLLPLLAAALTDLAQAIVTSATSDLAASIRLLAGVGSNPIYEGLGLLAPLVAASLLFGLGMVFVVLLFCMAAAVVLFVLSPFAFAGLVMAPTRVWFTRWATGMFALLFAKVPIAIMLALAVSLFADSRYAGTTQSFVNAGAGLVLGFGALLAPMLAFGLFSFMSSVVARPAMGGAAAQRAATSTYYGQQMTRTAVNGLRTVSSHGTTAPIEPSAAERQAGAKVSTTPSTRSGTPVPTPSSPAGSMNAPGGSGSASSSQMSGAASAARPPASPPATTPPASAAAGASGAAGAGSASGSAGAAGAASMAGPAAPVAAAAVAASTAAKGASSKAKEATARLGDTSGNPNPASPGHGSPAHGSITLPSTRTTD